jgi:hypothetical protein
MRRNGLMRLMNGGLIGFAKQTFSAKHGGELMNEMKRREEKREM